MAGLKCTDEQALETFQRLRWGVGLIATKGNNTFYIIAVTEDLEEGNHQVVLKGFDPGHPKSLDDLVEHEAANRYRAVPWVRFLREFEVLGFLRGEPDLGGDGRSMQRMR